MFVYGRVNVWMHLYTCVRGLTCVHVCWCVHVCVLKRVCGTAAGQGVVQH